MSRAVMYSKGDLDLRLWLCFFFALTETVINEIVILYNLSLFKIAFFAACPLRHIQQKRQRSNARRRSLVRLHFFRAQQLAVRERHAARQFNASKCK